MQMCLRKPGILSESCVFIFDSYICPNSVKPFSPVIKAVDSFKKVKDSSQPPLKPCSLFLKSVHSFQNNHLIAY